MKSRRDFIACGMVLALLTGCETLNIEQLATPARIKAVVSLAAYYGGKEVIKRGNADELRQGVAALKVLQASQTIDGTTLVAILNAIDLKGKLDSTEGALIFGAAVMFIDEFAGTTTPITDDARYRAVVSGLVRGFEVALGSATPVGPRATPALDVEGQLLRDAVATRKK